MTVEELRAVVRAFVPGVGLALLTLASELAGAPREGGTIALEMVRESGSEACPDAARVIATAGALFPDRPLSLVEGAADGALRVRISVRPEGSGHLALLVPEGRSSSERRIADPEPACGGLAEALAVALVVWMGSEDVPAAAPNEAAVAAAEPDADPAAEESPPKTPRNDEPELSERTVAGSERSGEGSESRGPFALGIEAAALGSLGLFAEPGFGGSVGVSVLSNLGIMARARLLRAVALPAEVPPGSVTVDLWAGLFAGCFRFVVAKRWSLAPCLELGWGRQHAEAEDLLGDNGEADRPWVVMGPNLAATFLVVEPFALLATGAAFGRLHEQVYLVDGERVAQQPRFGGYLGLGLSAEWPLAAAKGAASDRSPRVAALTDGPHAD